MRTPPNGYGPSSSLLIPLQRDVGRESLVTDTFSLEFQVLTITDADFRLEANLICKSFGHKSGNHTMV